MASCEAPSGDLPEDLLETLLFFDPFFLVSVIPSEGEEPFDRLRAGSAFRWESADSSPLKRLGMTSSLELFAARRATTGNNTFSRVPSPSARTPSAISSTVSFFTSLPHWRQYVRPTRANSNLK